MVGEFDAGRFQAEPFGVRNAACRNQYVAAFQRLLRATLLDNNLHCLPGLSGDALDLCVEVNVDAFILKEAAKTFAHIRIFAAHEMLIAIDDRYPAAEATHCLG